MPSLIFEFVPTNVSPSHVILISIICVVAILGAVILNSRRAGLSHIPGPFIARYTDEWSLWLAWTVKSRENPTSFYRTLQAEYGNVVRTGPRSVTVLDPFAVPTIYGVRSKLNKGPAYIPFRQSGVTTSLLSIPDEHTHSKYRKLVSNAYSMSSIKGYEPYVDQMVARFVEVCDQYATNKESMNLSLWCHYYCFDVIAILTLGAPIGCLDGQDRFGLIQKIKGFRNYASLVSQMPWLHKIFQDNPLLRRVKPSPFMGVVRSTVQDRLENFSLEDSQRPDLLSHFVATHSAYPGVMTDHQVLISASGNFIAGGLSPSSTFNELCYYLATHPISQERLFRELKEAKCSFPAGFDEVKHLPYLEGVIRGAYRLHNSASVNLQRVTGPAGIVLPDGTTLPGSVNIGCPAGTINRDTAIFGPDAEDYNPERWMQGEGEAYEAYEERRKLMDRSELSFGQGSRTCIGKNIVALEIFKVLATLVGLFKFELVGQPRKSHVQVFIHRRETHTR